MNRYIKKIAVFLAICISICNTNIMAFATSNTEYVSGYFKYIVENGSVAITGYNGRESEVTVPSQIAGTPVSKIASGAFGKAKTVTKVNQSPVKLELHHEVQ